jgi:hypothetical protein
MGFSVSLKSQNNLAKPLFLNSFSNKFFSANSSAFLVSPEKKNNTISVFLPSIKHTAFFCVMEDKVYGKLNVWIKLRAGSDEIYRKMIATP